MGDYIDCHFHTDRRAVADLEVGLDDVPACAPCVAQALFDERFDVVFYPEVPHDHGRGAVDALVEHMRTLAAA